MSLLVCRIQRILNNYDLLTNLNLTFWTARERSLEGVISFESRRYTHRISARERHKRIEFVQNKMTEQILLRLTGASLMDPRMYIPVPSVKYTRGKLVVNGRLWMTKLIFNNPVLGNYYQIFTDYWELHTKLRNLDMHVKNFRRWFGSECFTTGEWKYTKAFVRDMNAIFHFGKFFFQLSPGKQKACRLLWSDGLMQSIVADAPSMRVLKEDFVRIKEFMAYVSGGTVFELLMRKGLKSDLLDKIPIIHGGLLGQRTLTDRQLAGLQHRKLDQCLLSLWTLLMTTRNIKKTHSYSHKLRLVTSLSLCGAVVYRPLVSEKIVEGRDRPIIKFHSPVALKVIPSFPTQSARDKSIDINYQLYQVMKIQRRLHFPQMDIFAWDSLRSWLRRS